MAETIGTMVSNRDQGVTIGTYHTYDDWGLTLVSQSISEATPITNYVEVPGRNGPLDYTEFFGDVIYEQRTLSMTFVVPISASFWQTFSTVANAVHGHRLPVVFDTDPDWYYDGRVRVSTWEHDRGMGTIEIEVECDPYKLKKTETVVTKTVSGTTTMTLTNSRKPVVPEWTSTGSVKITFNGRTYTIGTAGTFVIPEIQLSQGNNVVTLSDSTATVTATYREGSL